MVTPAPVRSRARAPKLSSTTSPDPKNDPELSAGLGKLADYFVMDAFGTAHRAHSSTAGVAEHMKYSAAGYLMEKELKFLVGAVENPKRP